ncbi:DUF456 domain-containing protein [Abyssicoccus albus]|uniref:DUF456 domain-containing protein n=1 Tax=Abyssicoccus albus TaxID=1817405 RepID=UPI00097E2084|nr:DUF456 family protein [Abyssicoccus albus]AQL56761.1 hypothetical protein BVH56_07430 [Abyssicoccus albus]
MTIALWLIIIVLFLLGLVGIVLPMLPSAIFPWLGFFVYHFGINDDKLSWVFWTAMIVITLFSLISDFIASSYFVKKYGGSTLGEITAFISVIVGLFVFPPFGIILVPLIAVFIVEFIQNNDFDIALKASIGSFVGFLASTIAKVFLLLVMIIWFFMDITLF